MGPGESSLPLHSLQLVLMDGPHARGSRWTQRRPMQPSKSRPGPFNFPRASRSLTRPQLLLILQVSLGCLPQANASPKTESSEPSGASITKVGTTLPRTPTNTQEASPSRTPTAVGTPAPNQGCPSSPNYPNHSRPLQDGTLRAPRPIHTGEIKPQRIRGQSEALPARLHRSCRPSQACSPEEPKDSHHVPSYPRGAWKSATHNALERGLSLCTPSRDGTTIPTMPCSADSHYAHHPRMGLQYPQSPGDNAPMSRGAFRRYPNRSGITGLRYPVAPSLAWPRSQLKAAAYLSHGPKQVSSRSVPAVVLPSRSLEPSHGSG